MKGSVKALKDIVPNITLEQQQEINKREELAFKTGAFHVAYGLIAVMVVSFINVLLALFSPFYLYDSVIITSMIIFAFALGVFVDVWSHGYSH